MSGSAVLLFLIVLVVFGFLVVLIILTVLVLLIRLVVLLIAHNLPPFTAGTDIDAVLRDRNSFCQRTEKYTKIL